MTSKNIVFVYYALCISLVLVRIEATENEKSSKDSNSQYNSLSNKETHAEVREKRKVRDAETDSQKQKSNNLKKAEDQQQKLDLELAIETTRLEELNKLKKDEKIDDVAPTKWQKKLLNDINKTKKKTEELTVKAAAATSVSKTLAGQLTTLSSTPVKDENQMKDKTTKILKSLEEQNKIKLELALASTKLDILEKQREAEKIDVTTAGNKLTKWQKNLLSDITKAKEKRGDLTVAAAVIQTKIDQLKKQLTTVGGTTDNISPSSSKNEKELNEKLIKAQDNLWKINKDLDVAKTEFEHLQKRKDEKIGTQTNLTKKQKSLLNDIEKAKEKKYSLTLKAALENTLIEQLKQQVSSNGKSSSNGSPSSNVN